MASINVPDLKTKYDSFSNPIVRIFVDEKELKDMNTNLTISDLEVDMTSGYEASVASFFVRNSFDNSNSVFRSEDFAKIFPLGAVVRICLGYATETTGIFYGFVSKVNYVYQADSDMPGIMVTLMDAKGLMMANNHSKQLKAKCYSEAVKEILDSDTYKEDFFSKLVIEKIITDTPDKKQGGGNSENKASDETIEIVAESDYEFIVKAAKKFNYDFFIFAGKLVFRKAKAERDILMDLKPNSQLIRSLDIEYCINGLVSQVEARGMDTGKGELISKTIKMKNKISLKNKASSIIKNSTKVYIDSSIKSKEDAEARASSLAEEISYRFGSLNCETIGLPEFQPGFFVEMSSLGKGVGNVFYLTRVLHRFSGNENSGFTTTIYGKAAALKTD